MMLRSAQLFAALVLALALSSVVGAEEADLTSLDRVNRQHMHLNDWLFVRVYDPVARGYNSVVPKWGQRRIGSVIRNLSGPRDIVNSLLQRRWRRSAAHLARLVADSIFGIGGAFEWGGPVFDLHAPPETFSETLGVYGAASGPFLILPVIGETSLRGLVGSAADSALHPLSWAAPGTAASAGARALEGVDALAARMPPRGASSRRWASYLNMRQAASIAPYSERKEIFLANQAWDVER